MGKIRISNYTQQIRIDIKLDPGSERKELEIDDGRKTT